MALTQFLIVHLLPTEVLVSSMIGQLDCVDGIYLEAQDLEEIGQGTDVN